MKKEVRFAGFGGQGIALAGYIIGRAASVYAQLNATMTQSYGPESRGGASASDVIISDHEITYPSIRKPDILVILSQEAFDKYKVDLDDDMLLLVDTDTVKLDAENKGTIYQIPFVRTADDLGKKLVANIVMLGVLTAITKMISKKAMKEAILVTVPQRFKDLNDQAFEKGFEVGTNALEEQLQKT